MAASLRLPCLLTQNSRRAAASRQPAAVASLPLREGKSHASRGKTPRPASCALGRALAGRHALDSRTCALANEASVGAPVFPTTLAMEHRSYYRSLWASASRFCHALVKFSRPHTMIGTSMSVIANSLLAVQSVEQITPLVLWGVLQALIPALLMNISVVGFNQLCDVDIDKVNKPYLPLASGEFSLAQGQALVVGAGAMSLALGSLVGSPPLMWVLYLSVVMGLGYSANLPFLRWKNSPALAAGSILVIRAIAVQICFFLHMQTVVLQQAPALPFTVIFASCFMCFFSVVIAFFKDIPDVKGDRLAAIQTLSVRNGERTMLNLCVTLMLFAYSGAIMFGVLFSTSAWCRVLMVGAHLLLALSLWLATRGCDPSNVTSTTAAYMHLWKLFYAEYALIPFFGR